MIAIVSIIANIGPLYPCYLGSYSLPVFAAKILTQADTCVTQATSCNSKNYTRLTIRHPHWTSRNHGQEDHMYLLRANITDSDVNQVAFVFFIVGVDCICFDIKDHSARKAMNVRFVIHLTEGNIDLWSIGNFISYDH